MKIDKDYKTNAYYKNLYEALEKAFVKETRKLNSTNVKNGNETTFNQAYYSCLATLDFCENLTMYSEGYPYHNLKSSFEKIRNCSTNRIIANNNMLIKALI